MFLKEAELDFCGPREKVEAQSETESQSVPLAKVQFILFKRQI